MHRAALIVSMTLVLTAQYQYMYYSEGIVPAGQH